MLRMGVYRAQAAHKSGSLCRATLVLVHHQLILRLLQAGHITTMLNVGVVCVDGGRDIAT